MKSKNQFIDFLGVRLVQEESCDSLSCLFLTVEGSRLFSNLALI
jgi:hypothetical protein